MAIFNLPVMTLSDRTAPVISGTSVGNPIALDENIATSSLVATVTDDGTAVSFAIVSGDPNGDFDIANNGDITVVNSPDYEATTAYSLGITATDSLGNTSAPFTVTINITDIDEDAPIVTLVSQNYVAAFETENNLTIASFTASDAGSDVTSTLTLASGTPNATNFSLSYNNATQQMDLVTSASGQLGGGVTANQTFTFTISATDSLGNTGSTTCNLLVKSEPAFTGPTSVNVTENTTTTSTNVASYALLRPTPATWSLSGTDASDFTITSTGVVRFASNPDYELPSDSNQDRQYSLNVNAANVYGSASSNLIVNLQNDPSDDPLVYDVGPLTSDPPQHGFGVYGGDFFWTRQQVYNSNNYVYPVWFDVSANSISSGWPGLSSTSVNTDYRRSTNTVTGQNRIYTTAGNGYLLTRHSGPNNPELLRWNMSTSVGWTNPLHAQNTQSNANGGGIYNSNHGGLFIGSHYYARQSLDWYKWTSNSTPYLPAVDTNNNSQFTYNTYDGRVFYALIGNYIYGLPRGNWSTAVSPSEGGVTSGSHNYIRILNSTTFQTIGETSIQYWPGNNTSQTNNGIAYDGSNIWICRGDEIAKFTKPPSNNPTAQLVPTQ